ncbi:Holliday junction resolvase RuvX [Granulicoccus phenolivorans]|uniref:Holliday junction resolvase RuvX n=1 Tax=Granulicoccus phenolivorans TaxID=266854 RepID=UPI000419C86E|nr:Holliday junction resolvase RuvX [Granulicoccus phenolivorans]
MTDAGLRPGVRLALDWGDARIGVAACDSAGILAYPVETVAGGSQALARLTALVAEYEPIEVVIGLPRSLRGGEGPAAKKIRRNAASLARRISPIRVRFVDERFTTVEAARTLTEQGRTARQQRRVIDQVAAVTILEQALETERSTGQPPGMPLELRPAGEE